MEAANYNHCYGCGKDNPIGLQLKNKYIGEKSHIEFVVKREYCGHPGLLHGGVVGILFDEVMFHAIVRLGIEIVTLTITIDYKNPALEEHQLVCEAWIDKRDGRKIDVVAVITDSETGKVIAEGKGKYLEVDLKKVLEN